MRKRQKVLFFINAAIVALMGMLGVSCDYREFVPAYAPKYVANENPTVMEEKANVPEVEDKVLEIKAEEGTR